MPLNMLLVHNGKWPCVSLYRNEFCAIARHCVTSCCCSTCCMQSFFFKNDPCCSSSQNGWCSLILVFCWCNFFLYYFFCMIHSILRDKPTKLFIGISAFF